MSISAHNTKPEDEDFADIEFRPRSARMQAAPAKAEVKEEKKPEPPAPKEAPAKEQPEKEEATKAPADKKDEPETAPAKNEKAAKPTKKKEKTEKPDKPAPAASLRPTDEEFYKDPLIELALNEFHATIIK